MDEDHKGEGKKALQAIEVHDSWAKKYRNPENENFFSLAFDYISTVFKIPGGGEVLDAGCGSGTKTVQLAKRGYSICGVDISGRMIDIAKTYFQKTEWREKAGFQLEDLTAMSFGNGTFNKVLCWGVLMHVPEVEKAIGELARVTQSGGVIVISEGNMRSLQAVGLRGIKRLMGWQRAEVRKTPAGIEFWEETPAGKIVTRQSDMKWIVREFQKNGATLLERRAGQFTEIFTLLPWRWMRLIVHGFNNFYFKRIRLPAPAFGNLLVFRKVLMRTKKKDVHSVLSKLAKRPMALH